MVFKGTPSRSADDVNREFDEMGAHYNAFTNEENTVFYASVLPEHQDRAEELLADILRPSLREDDFETERQVILEEIQMYEDQPPFGADDKCRALHYGPHPLGRSVLGTVESVGGLAVEAMRDYFRRRYSPGNIVLAAAGRIDFDRLVALAGQCCGVWEPVEAGGGRSNRPRPAADFTSCTRRLPPSNTCCSFPPARPPKTTTDMPLKLLATVLGDDSGSRLYWELVDPGLAEHVSLGHGEHQGAGMMLTYMCCDPEHTADNLERLVKVYRQAEAEGVTAVELEQAKSKIRSADRAVQRAAPRPALRGGQRMGLSPSSIGPPRSTSRPFPRVTTDQLHAVLAKYPLTRATTVTIGPLADLPQPGSRD